MIASYFVLIAASLTFATGFFVASIIWSIKWLLSPKEVGESTKSVHLLHIFSKQDLNKEFALSSHSSELTINESAFNQELYQYHYGRN